MTMPHQMDPNVNNALGGPLRRMLEVVGGGRKVETVIAQRGHPPTPTLA